MSEKLTGTTKYEIKFFIVSVYIKLLKIVVLKEEGFELMS